VGFNPDELSTVIFAPSLLPPETQVVTDATTTYTTVVTSTFYYPAGSAALEYGDLGRNCSTISGYSYVAGNPSSALVGSRMSPRNRGIKFRKLTDVL
jgi:hypothetical protein